MKKENKIRKINLAKAKREIAKRQARFIHKECVDVFSEVWEKVGSFRGATKSGNAVHQFYQFIKVD